MIETAPGATAHEALSRADSAWLHMEEPTNHFVVTSLMVLGERLEHERLREALGRRLAALPRMTQRVAEPRWPLEPPRWEFDPGFELDAHLHRVALPAPGGRDALEEMIGDLIGQPLDLQRPPWQLFLVEDYEGGSAVVSRLHHCLGDGAAMVEMLLALADVRRQGWLDARPVPAARGGGPGRLPGAIETAGAIGRLLTSPGRAARLVGSAAATAATLARLSLLDPDPPTALRGRPGVLKRAAWSRPLRLAEVRSLAEATGATVNDVLVSVVAGGLGRHLGDNGGVGPGLRIRAMVPVNLRPRSGPVESGNRFSLVLLELPVGVAHPLERLMRVKIEMDRIKRSEEARAGWAVLLGLGVLPPALELPAASFFASKSTLVLTNVVGPRRRLYFAGSPIRSQAFWEPQSGGLGLGVSIYSYAGQVVLGAVSDAHVVSRPRELVAGFERSFEELARAAGREPGS